MAKKRDPNTAAVTTETVKPEETVEIEAPVVATEETVKIEEPVVPTNDTVVVLSKRDDPPVEEETPEPEEETSEPGEETSEPTLDEQLTSAINTASAVINSVGWNSTSALTDAQIQSLIDPFLTFAGSVDVETASAL